MPGWRGSQCSAYHIGVYPTLALEGEQSGTFRVHFMSTSSVGPSPHVRDPYDKLRDNDVLNFIDAMNTVRDLANKRLEELDGEEQFGYCIAEGTQMLLLRQAAAECSLMYSKSDHMEDGYLISAWKGHWNHFAHKIAEALETWDYSQLAI